MAIPNAERHQAIGCTAIKTGDGWFVVLPDETELGPCLTGMLALQVALALVLPARKQGLDAHVFVRNDRDEVNRCAMISRRGNSHSCSACEGALSRQQEPLCPLWKEMSLRAASACPAESRPRT